MHETWSSDAVRWEPNTVRLTDEEFIFALLMLYSIKRDGYNEPERLRLKEERDECNNPTDWVHGQKTPKPPGKKPGHTIMSSMKDWHTSSTVIFTAIPSTALAEQLLQTKLFPTELFQVPPTVLPLTVLPLTALPLTALPLTALPLTALPPTPGDVQWDRGTRGRTVVTVQAARESC
ncbi:unnamed protein product [Penicillium bialowiezense]